MAIQAPGLQLGILGSLALPEYFNIQLTWVKRLYLAIGPSNKLVRKVWVDRFIANRDARLGMATPTTTYLALALHTA